MSKYVHCRYGMAIHTNTLFVPLTHYLRQTRWVYKYTRFIHICLWVRRNINGIMWNRWEWSMCACVCVCVVVNWNQQIYYVFSSFFGICLNFWWWFGPFEMFNLYWKKKRSDWIFLVCKSRIDLNAISGWPIHKLKRNIKCPDDKFMICFHFFGFW